MLLVRLLAAPPFLFFALLPGLLQEAPRDASRLCKCLDLAILRISRRGGVCCLLSEGLPSLR